MNDQKPDSIKKIESFSRYTPLKKELENLIFKDREIEFGIYYQNKKRLSLETDSEYITVVWVAGHVFVSIVDVPDELTRMSEMQLVLIDPRMVSAIEQSKKLLPNFNFGVTFLASLLQMVQLSPDKSKIDESYIVNVDKMMETFGWKMKAGIKLQEMDFE